MFAVVLARCYQRWFRVQHTEERVTLPSDEEFEFVDNLEAQIDPDLKLRFRSACNYLPTVLDRLERSHLMQFYALYKQATLGPAKDADRPSFFDAKGKLKYEAWAQLGDMPRDVAMKTYIAKMTYMNLGWDPGVQSMSHGFGARPSRPMVVDGSSDDAPTAVIDREAVLWFTAAKADDITTVMNIFQRRPELLNETDQHLGMTALHWAIDSGCDKVIRYLLSKNVDVNAADPEGNTPLHFAACCHRQTAAEILISKGADRTLRNCDGQTPAEACDDPTLQAILTPS
ncbi:hypothetical protein KIN20_036749 [Parelaphostrongylus tenuis]|uniref:Acyl-CoA-binding domain-containing protein 6 n=1 Tax=Parelaphostrongylus tenuis TaxID=148309 RepID=A0AAD5RDK9_PARTN|nr:hypothetical protein KIN20_036749 [Parelaphostrongylus tenuis]